MTPTDPPTTSSDPGEPPADPVDVLRERIRAATEAAERLARDVTGGDREPGRPPPRGYAVPGHDGPSARPDPLVALLELARASLPVELAEQLAELVKELLLALKALIDWALDRVEQRSAAPVEVQDIPIT